MINLRSEKRFSHKSGHRPRTSRFFSEVDGLEVFRAEGKMHLCDENASLKPYLGKVQKV